ncbi:MAG: nickel-dependent hydrogenase large subunit [Planctomycetes bacterium]|nr:nickel-dependent hydrogenase large subunit [Planctomycetota bacterium]
MATRVTIDPITRIEGHLRIDVEVDAGAVSKAWASCTMWRGIEKILLGRDPREAWLFAQRFCGVCTTVHAIASVRAVEDALALEIPPNAQYIRNLVLLAHGLHDHIVHFYHLSALDWVDVTTVPAADPAKTAALAESVSPWPHNGRVALAGVRDKVKALVESGQLGPFAHGYWGHPAMRLSPEVNLLAVSHYLQAIDVQRKANQVVAMLGGKSPHIQNVAVGGVMNAVNLDSLATLNVDRLWAMKDLLEEVVPFVHQVYFVDACAIAAFYADWFGHGAGHRSYLAVPDLPVDGPATSFDLPGGTLFDGDLATVRRMKDWKDAPLRKAVTEDVTHAWYRGKGALHPFDGETVPALTDWEEGGKYSWVKAPRYDGRPMEVGPLAQVLVGYASGDPLTKKWVDKALEVVSGLAGRKVGPSDLMSTMGRHLARAVRCAMLAELALKHWQLLADNVLKGDATTFVPPTFPKGEVSGLGLHEAPRGTLSHWAVVEAGRIKNYQAVVPTTWNASPRDEKGAVGPYEAALLANPVADAERPLEVLRTVHSFDPCMACACHTFDASGKPVATVKVL